MEISGTGEVVAYWVCNHHPFETPDDATSTEFRRVPAVGSKTGLPNVLHMMEAERPDQYRGVPYLAQAIEPLLQVRRYTTAELEAAVIQASFSAFVKTEDPTDNPFNEVGDGTGAADPSASDDPNEYELGPGTINFMLRGEDVTFGVPSLQYSCFDAFVTSMATQVGAAVEVPAVVLV